SVSRALMRRFRDSKGPRFLPRLGAREACPSGGAIFASGGRFLVHQPAGRATGGLAARAAVSDDQLAPRCAVRDTAVRVHPRNGSAHGSLLRHQRLSRGGPPPLAERSRQRQVTSQGLEVVAVGKVSRHRLVSLTTLF